VAVPAGDQDSLKSEEREDPPYGKVDELTGNGHETLARRIESLSLALEKSNIAEYTEFLKRPYRVIYVNFLAGAARGFGIAIGITILGAVVLYILEQTFVRNIPVLGSFIADIVRIVELELGKR
jgi:hypothetical protein